MTSTSTSGSEEPSTSAPIWVCCRNRPFCWRSWRNIGPVYQSFNRLGQLVEVVLDVGAYDSGGSFGSQSHPTSGFILEGEHLLTDDVRALTHAPNEDLLLLEYRCPYLGVVVAAEEVVGHTFDPLPEVRALVRLPASGEDVVGPSRSAVAQTRPSGRYGLFSSSSAAERTGPCPA